MPTAEEWLAILFLAYLVLPAVLYVVWVLLKWFVRRLRRDGAKQIARNRDNGAT